MARISRGVLQGRVLLPPTIALLATAVTLAFPSPAELGALADFLRERINPRNLAVYDIYSGRDQGGRC